MRILCFANWDATPYINPTTNTTVSGKCKPANPVQSCYDVVAANNPVCESDTRLIQYVQDARSGILIEKAERIREKENRVCSVKSGASSTEYIRLRMKAPHGISKNGTKVLIKGMGKNDGLRAVFIVDDYTLTYLRKPGDSEMPTASSRARIYIPYESSEGIIEYTRGEDGRPAKKDAQCVKRETYEQCRSMPNRHKRRYVMLPTLCEVKRAVPAWRRTERGVHCGRKVQSRIVIARGVQTGDVSERQGLRQEMCVGESMSGRTTERGVCTVRNYEPCGYERHDAGIGPDPDHGNWHVTSAETSSALKVAENTSCGFSTTPLGNFESVDGCAQACAETLNCNFFMYGKGKSRQRVPHVRDSDERVRAHGEGEACR